MPLKYVSSTKIKCWRDLPAARQIAFTLFEKFEAALEKYHGQLTRAAVELAKEWRSDRALRKLEAMLIVADTEATLLISGNGDVIEPEHGVLAIGSGGHYAYAAATALAENTELEPADVVRKSPMIAASICVYTNSSLTIETLGLGRCSGLNLLNEKTLCLKPLPQSWNN